MSLQVEPLSAAQASRPNSTGFDSYRWLRGRHIDGTATIKAIGTPLATPKSSASMDTPLPQGAITGLRSYIDERRWQLRQHFYQHWESQSPSQQQAQAVTLSLLTGDRSLINAQTKALYQLAGISHLLAISGTHVLFLAILLAGLTTLGVNRFCASVYRYVPRWQVRWVVMIFAAFIYALFTGFDVPAARTAWTLLAVGIVRGLLLPISTARVLLALALMMAWHDPYVLWQAGYWLSFIAVALLLKYDDQTARQDKPLVVPVSTTVIAGSNPSSNPSSNLGAGTLNSSVRSSVSRNVSHIVKRALAGFKRLLVLQCWLFLALLPVTLLLFGKASLWGLVVNLFAIGVFGWILVPLNLLAGLCYLVIPAAADIIWGWVTQLIVLLHTGLSWLTARPNASWLYTPITATILVLAALAILPWLLPRGLVSRKLAILPVSILTMSVYANKQQLVQPPTVYLLPTGDDQLSAALLRYPASTTTYTDVDKQSVHWLFLGDHRPRDNGSRRATITAEQLSDTLSQHLGALAVEQLEGIVVQTAPVGLNTKRGINTKRGNRPTYEQSARSLILPATVARVMQRIPTHHYWQAGRRDAWQPLDETQDSRGSDNATSSSTPHISGQDCVDGKRWDSRHGDIRIEAITGWRTIADDRVWDCSVQIASRMPIRIVAFAPAKPLASPVLFEGGTGASMDTKRRVRLVLDAATTERLWQLWTLLCADDSSMSDDIEVTWLSHSGSPVTSEVLRRQRAGDTVTFDGRALQAALGVDYPSITSATPMTSRTSETSRTLKAPARTHPLDSQYPQSDE